MKSPILVYTHLNKPYTLFTYPSRYVWYAVLTEEYTASNDGKIVGHQHPVTYVSGFFRVTI